MEPTSIENLDSKTYPTFGHNLDDAHFSNSEQSDTLNETPAERGDNLELALVDGASDIDDNLQEEDLQEEDLQEEDLEEEDLQEEDDPEVSSHYQLLDAYTEGVTSGIEGESCDNLGSIFDCPGSLTSFTLYASY